MGSKCFSHFITHDYTAQISTRTTGFFGSVKEPKESLCPSVCPCQSAIKVSKSSSLSGLSKVYLTEPKILRLVVVFVCDIHVDAQEMITGLSEHSGSNHGAFKDHSGRI